MNERLSGLLRIVVEEYVATSEPVGSHHLVERYRLDVSPATVRNWSAELEEEGYLHQPHTSGGRMPTEKGYRAYIDLFVRPKSASKRERELLEKKYLHEPNPERRVKATAKLIAELLGLAVVVGLREADTFYTGLSQLFAQQEFKDWQRVVSMTEILDRLDETMRVVRRRRFDETRILIGRECPFGPACGSVLAAFDGGIIGILGPIRMDYQRAFSLMDAAKERMTREA